MGSGIGSSIWSSWAGAVGAVSGTDSRGAADRAGADAASLPHQAPVLDLLRTRAGDAGQRPIPPGEWTSGTAAQAGADSRFELEPQPRDEESVQGHGHGGQRSRRSVARILSGTVG